MPIISKTRADLQNLRMQLNSVCKSYIEMIPHILALANFFNFIEQCFWVALRLKDFYDNRELSKFKILQLSPYILFNLDKTSHFLDQVTFFKYHECY